MDRQQPLVSVIIPTFNRASLVSETLDSVVNQTYKNWECIVVDDGSTDNTQEVVRSYVQNDHRFSYYQRPERLTKGANACRNFGFEMSRGEYINWFDDDDIMHKDKLLWQVSALQGSDLNFSVCQTMMFEDNVGKPIGLRKGKIISDNPFEDFVTDKIKWLTQAPIIRRKFLEENGLTFDESLHRAQEWDFFVRLLAIDDKYLVDERPLVYFRKHSKSISSGVETREKIESSFVATQKALYFQSRMSETTIFKLKRSLIKFYLDLLAKRFFLAAFAKGRELKKMDFSYWYKIKVDVALLSYYLFNRGHGILK